MAAKQCRHHPRNASRRQFEFSQKALRVPKVEFAKSRSRFGDYIHIHIYIYICMYLFKMVQHHERTVNTE